MLTYTASHLYAGNCCCSSQRQRSNSALESSMHYYTPPKSGVCIRAALRKIKQKSAISKDHDDYAFNDSNTELTRVDALKFSSENPTKPRITLNPTTFDIATKTATISCNINWNQENIVTTLNDIKMIWNNTSITSKEIDLDMPITDMTVTNNAKLYVLLQILERDKIDGHD